MLPTMVREVARGGRRGPCRSSFRVLRPWRASSPTRFGVGGATSSSSARVAPDSTTWSSGARRSISVITSSQASSTGRTRGAPGRGSGPYCPSSVSSSASRPRSEGSCPYVKATDVVYTATLDDAAVEAVATRIAARIARAGICRSPGCPAPPALARGAVSRRRRLATNAVARRCPSSVSRRRPAGPDADRDAHGAAHRRRVRVEDSEGPVAAARRASLGAGLALRALNGPRSAIGSRCRASGKGRGRLRRDAGDRQSGHLAAREVAPDDPGTAPVRMPLIRFLRHPRAPAQIGRAGSRRKRQTRRLP